MESASIGALRNLLTAAEPVCHDEHVARRLAHGRQEHALADCLRDVVMLALEPERSSLAS
jgi:hypothetical protein